MIDNLMPGVTLAALDRAAGVYDPICDCCGDPIDATSGTTCDGCLEPICDDCTHSDEYNSELCCTCAGVGHTQHSLFGR